MIIGGQKTQKIFFCRRRRVNQRIINQLRIGAIIIPARSTETNPFSRRKEIVGHNGDEKYRDEESDAWF